MKSKQFKEVMATLSACYPAADISKETLGIYWIKFRNADYGKFKKACNMAIEQSDYFPSIHRIIENMGNKISIDDVICELKQKVIAIPLGESFSKKSLNPITANILKSIGGKHRISMMTDIELNKQVKIQYNYAVEDGILRLPENEYNRIT